MDHTTMYLVIGRTGEYADKQKWPVAVHNTEESAEEHSKRAQEWATTEFTKLKDRFQSYKLRGKNPHDPDMECDHTGTTYSVTPVLYAGR